MAFDLPQDEPDLDTYFSTYQWVTVGQLLEGYGLKLLDTSVLLLLGKKTSFYFQLLQVPVINVMSGIILEQVKTYRIYLQKLFVEYLVSGQADVEGDAGADTREALEKSRQEMLAQGKAFDETERSREDLIIETQTKLMQFVDTFKQIVHQAGQTTGLKDKVLYDLFADAKGFQIQDAAWARLEAHLKAPVTTELQNSLNSHFAALTDLEKTFESFNPDYQHRAQDIRKQLIHLRRAFYDEIGHTQQLLAQVAEFHLDEEKNEAERQTLHFDGQLGEEKEG